MGLAGARGGGAARRGSAWGAGAAAAVCCVQHMLHMREGLQRWRWADVGRRRRAAPSRALNGCRRRAAQRTPAAAPLAARNRC